jgi:pyruvate/2-oxoglutarate dehydrogenase complex dihydrolipoamide dehydrogenase (E3) component/uncharacterized membrane protein YdjX (TVP38/TMEM64 family)
MSRIYQIIVIGAGAGGLVVAIGGARAGKKVLLIERGTYGGDCTNFGCIPSKSLIASAEAAHAMKEGWRLGVEGSFSNASRSLERVRRIVSEFRALEEPNALQEKGVETLTGTARFIGPHTLQVGDEEVQGNQIVIATGSSPRIPEIEGLKGTPYLTNETVFKLETIPKSLCVIGGGPIGCELAQAFCRLGSEVFLIHRHALLLKKEEPEACEAIVRHFKNESIHLYLGHQPLRVDYRNLFTIFTDKGARIEAEALLVAVGRNPNLASLHLEAAGIEFSKEGISVDRYGRTSQKHIWAIGDVVHGPRFTHASENQARSVLASLLLPFKIKISGQPVPRATYTSPEVAAFGLLEKEAAEKFGRENIAVYMVPLSENDRAVTAGLTDGFVKIVTKKLSSRILGGTVVSPRAGEILPELSLAAKEKIPLRKIAQLIHPYPTYNLAIRRAGDLWLTQIFLPWLKHPSKWLPWKRFIPLFLIIFLMIIAYSFGVHKYLSFETLQKRNLEIKHFVAEHPVLTPLLYMVIYTVAVALSLPGGAILSLAGGFLFPVPWSTLYVLAGATLGATVIFLAAKTFFGELLRKKAGPQLKKMEKGFQENAWSYLLFLRFVPLFPFWLVNIAPAFFNVRLVTYVWTTFVGIIPGAYVFTQAGTGLSAIFEKGESFSLDAVFNRQIRLALIAIALFALIPIAFKKFFPRLFRGQKN